ncbi:hypothetical protein ACN47E_007228 [Coniothyrium glycines]
MSTACDAESVWHKPILEPQLAKQITYHLLALSICCSFTCIAVSVSVWHILQHAMHYFRPSEQKHIIRILATIPIYASTTFLGYIYYRDAVYYEIVRNCYEAYAIASFFTLMCHYLAPNLHEQKAYLRQVQPKNWAAPLSWLQKLTGGENKGWLRRPESGLTWFNIVYFGVFQYCVIRPVFMVVALVVQSQKLYCQSSTQPRFASLWITLFDAISIIVAMYCLVQFYFQFKDDMALHRPTWKIVSIKVVIFFVFWQDLLIAILTRDDIGAIKPDKNPLIAAPDLRIGIPALLTSVEMATFATLHCWAFPWKQYAATGTSLNSREAYVCGPITAVLEAMNPWDYAKAAARGFRWVCYGARLRKSDASCMCEREPVVSSPSLDYLDEARTSPFPRRSEMRTSPGCSESIRQRARIGRRTM